MDLLLFFNDIFAPMYPPMREPKISEGNRIKYKSVLKLKIIAPIAL